MAASGRRSRDGDRAHLVLSADELFRLLSKCILEMAAERKGAERKGVELSASCSRAVEPAEASDRPVGILRKSRRFFSRATCHERDIKMKPPRSRHRAGRTSSRRAEQADSAAWSSCCISGGRRSALSAIVSERWPSGRSPSPFRASSYVAALAPARRPTSHSRGGGHRCCRANDGAFSRSPDAFLRNV